MKKVWQTDGQADRRPDWTIHRAAWSQLKTGKGCSLYEQVSRHFLMYSLTSSTSNIAWTRLLFLSTNRKVFSWPPLKGFSLAPGRSGCLFKMQCLVLFYWLISSVLLMVTASDECHGTSPKNSQHWFRQLFGAARQQAITWSIVDTDLCRIWCH